MEIIITNSEGDSIKLSVYNSNAVADIQRILRTSCPEEVSVDYNLPQPHELEN